MRNWKLAVIFWIAVFAGTACQHKDGSVGDRAVVDDIHETGTVNRPTIQQRERTAAQLPPPPAEAGQLWVDPVDGSEMVYVPAGEFIFGTPPECVEVNRRRQYDPVPEQRIQIGAFWISRLPITNAQYRQFVDATEYPEPYWWHNRVEWPSVHLPEGRPWEEIAQKSALVYQVAAKDYCRWAGKSLCTEEEWEEAARSTDGRRYPWGNEWREELGRGSTPPRVGPWTIDVSPYGCVGMFGGREWTTTEQDGFVVTKGLWYPTEYPGPPFDPEPCYGLWHRSLTSADLHSQGWSRFRCVVRAKEQ